MKNITKRIIAIVLVALTVFSVCLVCTTASSAAEDKSVIEIMFLLGCNRCPECLELQTFDDFLSLEKDTAICDKCNADFSKEDIIKGFQDYMHKICPDLTEKEANDLGLATMGICPECGKELMEKEITTNTDNMTSTITVGYCSCGFDVSKNSKYMDAMDKFTNALIGEMFSLMFKYPELMEDLENDSSERPDTPEDNEPTTKPETTKPTETTNEKPTDKPADETTKPSVDVDETKPSITIPTLPENEKDENGIEDTAKPDSDLIIESPTENPPTGVEKYGIAAAVTLVMSIGAIVALKKKKD